MAESECAPLEKLLNQISGQWTMYILWILDINGTMRYGDLVVDMEKIPQPFESAINLPIEIAEI